MEAIVITAEFILLLLKAHYIVLIATYKLFVPNAEKSVKGEIVLITGTGHGIGKELALQYASQSATVVCWDINEKTNQETVKKIAQLGYTKAHAYVCDVTNRVQVKEMTKRVQEEVGDISILINNAGIMPSHLLLQHTPIEIERTININLVAHFWTLQAILPIMIKNNRGHIVAISSVAGLGGFENNVPYCASKWAVRGMMEALDRELRINPNCQIKLTTIYPYMVDTGLCKRPEIRFTNNMPVLSPRCVSEHIMSAQRRAMREISIPRYFLPLGYVLRLYPDKVKYLTQDILNTCVGSDLETEI